MTAPRSTSTQHLTPADAFVRGLDRRAELRAGLLVSGDPRDLHGPFEVRPALPADHAALLGVAGRDSAQLPDGPLLHQVAPTRGVRDQRRDHPDALGGGSAHRFAWAMRRA